MSTPAQQPHPQHHGHTPTQSPHPQHNDHTILCTHIPIGVNPLPPMGVGTTFPGGCGWVGPPWSVVGSVTLPVRADLLASIFWAPPSEGLSSMVAGGPMGTDSSDGSITVQGPEIMFWNWCWWAWNRTRCRCSSNIRGFLFIRTAPNQDSIRGPEFLTPSRISQGQISLVSCTLRP